MKPSAEELTGGKHSGGLEELGGKLILDRLLVLATQGATAVSEEHQLRPEAAGFS